MPDSSLHILIRTLQKCAHAKGESESWVMSLIKGPYPYMRDQWLPPLRVIVTFNLLIFVTSPLPACTGPVIASFPDC